MNRCHCLCHCRYHDINYSKLFDKFTILHFDEYLHCARETGQERSRKDFFLFSARFIEGETRVSRQENYNFCITIFFALC